jgi:hypothetical protein
LATCLHQSLYFGIDWKKMWKQPTQLHHGVYSPLENKQREGWRENILYSIFRKAFCIRKEVKRYMMTKQQL